MPASKIQNHTEVARWFREGRTYRWMVDQYREKYHIETTPSMWGNYRRRQAIEPRHARESMVPWRLRAEHRTNYMAQMLRAEGRRRAGLPNPPATERRLDAFIARLDREGLVVHYDADLPEGFFMVPAREGVDVDLIREPDAP